MPEEVNSKEKIDAKIRSIIESCANVSNDEIHQLKPYQILRKAYLVRKQGFCDIYLCLGIVFGCLALISTSISLFGTRELFNYIYSEYVGIDLDNEPCLVPKLEMMIDLFRPTVSCDICHHIEEIDRVSNITREEFEEKYAYTNRPVIVTDAMKDWLALEKFDYDFFYNLYGENSTAVNVVEEQCQFFPYKNMDEFLGLSDVFRMNYERAHMTDKNYRPWYVGWSNCDYSTAIVLRQFYSRPYFLPTKSESSKLDWIFMVTHR